MRRPATTSWRAGFTIAELLASLGLLAVLLTLVAQVGLSALLEKQRGAERQAGRECASNILEAARGCDWNELTPEWAGRQRLPDLDTLRDWGLEVTVEPEPKRPLVKRVKVKLTWPTGKAHTPKPIEMVGLFAARGTKAPGGKP